MIILIGVAIAAGAKGIIRGTTMSSGDVKSKWGSEKLDFEKFKVGTAEVRAGMAYEILNDSSLIGKDVDFIREKLGSPNGYYFIDAYPAYIIQRGKNHSEDTWQIVFTLDRKYKVDDIFVHKNCCER